MSAATLEELELRLNMAGLRGRNVLAPFIGAKLLALIGLPLLGWLVAERAGRPISMRLLTIAGAGLAGLLLPDYVVRLLHRRHSTAQLSAGCRMRST